jgi:hypothetical protein
MAKVKIQGNASGTGILTVTAPNTSTDRTITLPDSTATIATTTDVALKAPIASPTFTGTVSVGTGDISSVDSNSIVVGSGATNLRMIGVTNDIRPANADGSNSDNDIDLGDANARFKDLYLSGGLKVGGTGTANTLDDYETGTCTIQYSDGTTTIGNTPNTMKYTKIGKTVTVNGYVNNTNTDSLTGSQPVKLVGFPFTNNAETSFSIFTRYLNSPTGTHNVIGYFGSSTTAHIYYMKDNDSYQQVICSELATSSNDLYLSITYQTDS